MKKFMQIPIIAVVAFALAHCSAKKSERNTENEIAVAVKTQQIERVPYTPVLKYSGSIASTSEAKLSFKIGGIISKIYVKEGDKVVKGQLLATLDLTEINAQVNQAEQSAEKAARDVNRVKNLYNDTVATLEQLQNVNTQHDVAVQGLRIAKFNQQFAQIKATENGTIIKKMMNEGEYANSGSPVFFFSGTASSEWVVRMGVADRDWARLNKGDLANVYVDAYPDKIFEGKISEIATGADPLNGTYEVEVKLDPRNEKFAPGLFANVQLHSRGKELVSMVPIEALAEGDGRKGFVYTVTSDNKKVKKNAVTIAFLEKNKIGISSGLENEKEVITAGVGYLTEHSTVKVVN